MNSLTAAERAELEQERLARQKRRNGQLDDDGHQVHIGKRVKTDGQFQHVPEIPDKEVIEISDDEEDADVDNKTSHNAVREKGECFWDGESRSVRNQLVVNPAKTFSLDEIIGAVSRYTKCFGLTKI